MHIPAHEYKQGAILTIFLIAKYTTIIQLSMLPSSTVGTYILLNSVIVFQFILDHFPHAVQSIPNNIIYLESEQSVEVINTKTKRKVCLL